MHRAVENAVSAGRHHHRLVVRPALPRLDQTQPRQTEIRHGARGRADIFAKLRLDQDDDRAPALRAIAWSCRCRRPACALLGGQITRRRSPCPSRPLASSGGIYPAETTRRLAAAHISLRRRGLLPAECGCYRARAELPSVEFPVGDVRAENNSFEGRREKPFQRARQCSVSGRPKQARRPEVQACQISKSCGQRSMKPRRSRPIPCCRSSKPSWARRACP